MPIIQLISDVHGNWDKVEIDDRAQVIAALGDMQDGPDAITILKKFGKPVIYVPGNHEYYGGEIEQRLIELKQMAAGTQVIIADNLTVTAGKTRFICATLWSDHNGMDVNLIAHSLFSLNDYRNIRVDQWITNHENRRKYISALNAFESANPSSENLLPETPQKMNPIVAKILHQDSINFIVDQLSKKWDGHTVVLTHHAPSLSSLQAAGYFSTQNPRKFPAVMNRKHKPHKIGAYANSLDYIFANNKIDLWMHGHIHEGIRYTIHGTDVITNPTGYNERQNVKFKIKLLLTPHDSIRHLKILCVTLYDSLQAQIEASSIVKRAIIQHDINNKCEFELVEDFIVFAKIYNQAISAPLQQHPKDCNKPDYILEQLNIQKILRLHPETNAKPSLAQKIRFLHEMLTKISTNEKRTKEWLTAIQKNEQLNKWTIEGDI